MSEEDQLRARIERLKAGRREAAQILIVEIGAPGPESIVETATRAAKRITELGAIAKEAAVLVSDARSSDPGFQLWRLTNRYFSRPASSGEEG